MTFSLQQFLNEKIRLDKPIRVIYVAGLDLFNRCHGMNGLREKDVGGVAVVYRIGQDSSLIQSILQENPSKLYFIPSSPSTFYSRDKKQKKKEERSDVKLIIVTGTGRQGQKENVRLPILPDIVIKESIVRRTNLDRVTKILYPEVY